MQRIALCIFLLFMTCSVARDIRTNQYTQYYQSLPEELKLPFLQYQLASAVLADNESSRIKISPVDESLKTPEGLGLSEDVFEEIEQIVVIARGKEWCFGQRKQCFDIGDPGANCC
ncbi:hypothetical protein C0J52_09999 [Blattella germanica]|nr:hypothetical protein C0J52_09999 [Blattella germanica]